MTITDSHVFEVRGPVLWTRDLTKFIESHVFFMSLGQCKGYYIIKLFAPRDNEELEAMGLKEGVDYTKPTLGISNDPK